MKVNPLTKEVTLTEDEYNDLLYKDSSMIPISRDELTEKEQKEYDNLSKWAEETGNSVTIIKFPDTDKIKQFEVKIWRLKNKYA